MVLNLDKIKHVVLISNKLTLDDRDLNIRILLLNKIYVMYE